MRKSAENQRRYRARYPEKIKVANKVYRKENQAKIKVYNEMNQEKYRSYELKRKYNLTIEEYNELFVNQCGKCAICGKHQTKLKMSLAVDHCHETGKIRGLLCSNCNRGIGLLNNDIENLKCAIIYLNKSGQPCTKNLNY